jgi:putative glutamine amidotransferase
MAEQRPLVGITGPRRGSFGPRTCIALGVWLSGARPVQLRPGKAVQPRALDGIVISGGHDIEPVLYARASEVEGNYDPQRDAFESEIIDQALRDNVPLLGICRGAQLINVRLGGSLFQNLRDREVAIRRRRSLFPVTRVSVTGGSKLGQIVNKEQLIVNSLHNQSIDRTGVGLTVSAKDGNDIVQAVETAADDFVIGIQWHPEFMLYLRSSRMLFRALSAAARTRREMRRPSR